MKPQVYSSGFVLFRNEVNLQFLLMKHIDRWDLPKGHLDFGETKRDAALRELREETGIPNSAIWIDDRFEFSQQYQVTYRKQPNRPLLKELTIFLAFLRVPCDIQPTEHPDYQWWDWNPPHQIQLQTIDPLLSALESFFQQHPQWPNLIP